ncbi:MAG: alanine racemase C-terminal domain-containing protein [Fimbriimonadales bacterium]
MHTRQGGEHRAAIRELPCVQLEGISTHFANSSWDVTGTEEQIRQYDGAMASILAASIDVPYKHIANSAGAIRYLGLAETWCARAWRLGIDPYNLFAGRERPVLTWRARVMVIRELSPRSPVSYAGTGPSLGSASPNLGVGYGDGFPRHMSNKGHVLIRGKRAPIVGLICMDQVLVDVSRIPDVEPGDLAKSGRTFVSPTWRVWWIRTRMGSRVASCRACPGTTCSPTPSPYSLHAHVARVGHRPVAPHRLHSTMTCTPIELGYNEHRTSELIRRELGAAGIRFAAGLAKGTGVLGWLPATTNPDTATTIALRADAGRPSDLGRDRLALRFDPHRGHAPGHDGHRPSAPPKSLPKRRNGRQPPVPVQASRGRAGAGGRAMCGQGSRRRVLGKPG